MALLLSHFRRNNGIVLSIMLLVFSCFDPFFSIVDSFGIVSNKIHVWDDVLTFDQCQDLHDLAKDHQNRVQEDSHVFRWNNKYHIPNEKDPSSSLSLLLSLTPLECAIASIIHQLYHDDQNNNSNNKNNDDDNNIIVEYWTRQEYLDLEIHADMDEGLLETTNDEIMGVQLQYPTYAHVLYLLAGEEEEEDDDHDDDRIRKENIGPTCIFPSHLGGWNTTRCTGNGADTTTSMVTVPVVPGRVLRFPGSAMHAVPKPLYRWFDDVLDQDENEWQCGDDDDDDDADDRNIVRSVVLFNIWYNGKGPSDVTTVHDDSGDYFVMDRLESSTTATAMPDGIELEDDHDDNVISIHRTHSASKKANVQKQIDAWKRSYGSCYEQLHCQLWDYWNPVEIVSEQATTNKESLDGTQTPLCMALMGSPRRRLWANKFVKLHGNKNSIRLGLQETTAPRSFELRQQDTSR